MEKFLGGREPGLAADELRTPWVFWQPSFHTPAGLPLAHPIPFPLASGPTFFSPASQFKRFSSRGYWENGLSVITTSGVMNLFLISYTVYIDLSINI